MAANTSLDVSLAGLDRANRRAEIRRAQVANALDARVTTNETDIAAIGVVSTYTPTVTQSNTITGNSACIYSQIGDWVIYQFSWAATGTGTAAQPIYLSLPVTADASRLSAVGAAQFYDSSTARIYPVLVACNNTTRVAFTNVGAVGAGAWYLGTSGFTAAVASGDSLAGTFIYKV